MAARWADNKNAIIKARNTLDSRNNNGFGSGTGGWNNNMSTMANSPEIR
jgi:hypothetical protein